MLDDQQILAIIDNELQHSSGGGHQDTIDADRQEAYAYYYGQVRAGTPGEEEGRSSVVSTDVADAIEWMLPEIVKQFTKSHDVVRFDAIGEGDEEQAELESAFVYDLIMKRNDGYALIYTLAKDVLLQRNCFYKTFYEENIETDRTEEYTGIDLNGYAALMAQPGAVPLEETVRQDPNTGMQVFDVKIAYTSDNSLVKVMPIPPEEARVSAMARSVNLKEARFCAHVVFKTASDLIEDGVPEDVVENLPKGTQQDYNRDYRWTVPGEVTYPDGGETIDPSQALIEVSECYLNIDVNEDGIAELMKIDVAGGDSPTEILSMQEITKEEHAMNAGVGILMPHKFYGISVFDRLREIQDQKTALWRSTLDNLYLQNNQRITAVDGRVDLDTLLTSSPYGIILQDEPGMVGALQVPPIGQDAFKMMEYLDVVRAGRVGVQPDSNIADQFIGLQGGDASVDRIMTAKEELVGLITRTFAETVFKPMMLQVRDLARRHLNIGQDYYYGGAWRKVNPSQWKARTLATVDVGTGSGNTKEQQAAMSLVLQLQEKILQQPGQSLVNEDNVYSAVDRLAKMSGLKGISRFFMDPNSEKGKQHKQNVQSGQKAQEQKQDQAQQVMLQAQATMAQAETMKAQATQQGHVLKAQNEQQKLQLQAEIERLKAELLNANQRADMAAKDADLSFKYDELESKNALKLTEIEVEHQAELSRINQENRQNRDWGNGEDERKAT